jgi:hypothetical protein
VITRIIESEVRQGSKVRVKARNSKLNQPSLVEGSHSKADSIVQYKQLFPKQSLTHEV